MKHTPAWQRAFAVAFLAATAMSAPNLARAEGEELGQEERSSPIPPLPNTYSDWPHFQNPMRRDPATEAWIRRVVKGMSLEEKVGQMTQPEIQSITPEEVRQYHIGSVLNGGGSWPGKNKHASPSDWVALADAYWDASMSTSSTVKIPILWGIDAVHGNNNVYGATAFPHNIGLGAAHDPHLLKRIGTATAIQVRATGQDWAFGPCLAVVRDDRWGRTYEGFSEDPSITRKYADEMIEGMQLRDRHGRRLSGVLATAKHYIGDGGTDQGKDQGINKAPESDLINIHGQGYYGAFRAGVQTVMASFNSWANEDLGIHEGKIHGSKYLLNDVLKEKMGFDGLVVSDWNGIGQVTGCSNYRCAQAINAGIDLFMVPEEWKQFIENTLDLVRTGEVPMSRIDDAVTRILRVKVRAGLFSEPKPSQRLFAGEPESLEHRELAREAVRESLVLLKNNGNVLPLHRDAKVLVVGKSADSMSNQTGGWTLTWQGTTNTNADFPNGETILSGIKEAIGTDHVTFSEKAEGVNVADYQAVIAVIGETPYAEGIGDIGKTKTLEHARLYPEDLAVLDKVSGRGVPVVTVLVSGRPLYVNKELNRSDAFIAAWLPGTEGGGVADLLFRKSHDRNHHGQHDFRGKLSYSWPKAPCQTPLNVGDTTYDPLFPFGYGLSLRDQVTVGALDETTQTKGCGQTEPPPPCTEDLPIYNSVEISPYTLSLGSPANWNLPVGTDPTAVVTSADGNISISTTDVNVQADGKRVTWSGSGPGQVYLQATGTTNLGCYTNTGALMIDVIVNKAPVGSVKVRVDCVYPCIGEVDATNLFRSLPIGVKRSLKIPLQCFANAGTDFSSVNTPFLVFTDQAFQFSFANIRWSPNAGKDVDVIPCDDLKP